MAQNLIPGFSATFAPPAIRKTKISAAKATSENLVARFGLTKKAEPPPTRGFRKTKAAGDGGWLRRLVRPRKCHNSK